jgi:hypothetical protein
MSAPVLLCGSLPGAAGGTASTAALAVALASMADAAGLGRGERSAVVVELGGAERRGPTMLAAEGARALERALREAGFAASARGRIAWVGIGEDEHTRLAECVEAAAGAAAVLVLAPVARWSSAIEEGGVKADGALIRADLPAQRALAALATIELRAAGLRVRVSTRAPGRVATRRALAGIEPGGETGRRSERLARGLLGPAAVAGRPARSRPGTARESGQALPLVLAAAAVLIVCTLVLAALGGAASGVARAQRVADLAALSAARSMRDDFDRLFSASRPGGIASLPKADYLARARAAALDATRRNGGDPQRVRVRFPDADSFAPLRVRVELPVRLEGATGKTTLRALAEAVPPASADPGQAAPVASGGDGYAGPLAHRGGEPMRPDVAAAFDRLATAAGADGIVLIVNSGYRSDAEQAALFAANPDPRWVAPPGRSLHRCGTELDLGPPAAYGWLAVNAPRFGFVKRYSWEPWHFGFVEGAPPCSAVAEPDRGDGDAAGTATLPPFVPARFRSAIGSSAARWNVPATVLAAQLLAESNFNPFAVSAAGAAGIAQFTPGTAVAYGLRDRFDPGAAIDAQGHLMSDLLRQFAGRVPLALAAYNAGPAPVAACGCVPGYPETQAYVARILGLLEGAGAIVAPALEVRLVS